MQALVFLHSFLIIIIFTVLNIYGAQPAPQVTVNIPLTVHSQAHATPLTTISQANANTTSITTINTILVEARQLIQQIPSICSNQLASITQWYAQYKYHLIAGIVGVNYVSLWRYLYTTHRYFDDKKHWFWWHTPDYVTTPSCQTLFITPQEELIKSLLTTIQERYLHAQEPTNGIYPLIQFIQECTHEEKIVRTYLRIISWIKKLYLHKLPFLPELQQEKAEQFLHRLLFIQTIFKKWAAEQNYLRLQL